MKLKNSILLFIIIVTLAACSSENEMKLTGNINGLKKGTLILQKVEDTVLVSLDSIQINGDSNFTFKYPVESPELYYLYLRLKDGTLLDERIPFFAEAGEINIKSNLKTFGNAATITGSSSHDTYVAYEKIMQRFTDKNVEYIAAKFEALSAGNDSLAKAMENNQDGNLKRQYLASVNFAINNNDSEIAPYIATVRIVDANKKLLDTIYKSLTPRIKESTYGKRLEALLNEK